MSSFRVALTFDAEHGDRPAQDGNAERLLESLATLGQRATFFVQGRWAEAHPGTARRIADAGHLVGSHSYYHARLPLLTARGLSEDTRDAEAAIRDHVGVDPRPWFRCPFGAGADDPDLLSRLAALGYGRHVGWHVTAEDWEPDKTADELIATVVDGATRHGDGAVVLLHTWPDPTVAGMGEMVARLTDAGASLVAVDDLDDPPTGIPADDPQ